MKKENDYEKWYLNEIQECFNYLSEDEKFINKENWKSIMGNYGWNKFTSNEMEKEIKKFFKEEKDNFDIDDVLNICKTKFKENYKNEIKNTFNVFDLKGKGYVTSTDIKHLFDKYLDIFVPQSEIDEFILDHSKEIDKITLEDFQKNIKL